MTNEVLLLVMALISAVFVVAGWRLGKERLYSVIIVLLILIAIVGGKIVPFFGYITNAGNIFYASVFLATYFLIERYGKQEGLYSVGVGVGGVVFFATLAWIATLFVGSPLTSLLSDSLSVALGQVPRVAFASVASYVLSQCMNVYLFAYLKQRFDGKYLWLRANISNAVAQLFDSAVFFTIAFWGTAPSHAVIEIIVVGLTIKVVFMMVAAPLLYFNRIEDVEDHSRFVRVTLE